MRAGLRFTKRAEHDWFELDGTEQARVASATDRLRSIPRPENLDEKPLEGHAPWRRLRVGDLRIIFRPFTADEKRTYEADQGYVVGRVVDRRDLERAVKGLR